VTAAGRPDPWPVASTRPVAVLGWPVRHSLSPVLHNAAFAELDLDLVYLALPVPPERLAEVVTVLGAVEALGANVTVPHKVAVADLCDVLTEEARLIGAVNTLHFTDDGLVGDNTDATGLRDALERDLDPAAGESALLLGTGGAARAAAVAAGRLGLEVVVAGRRPDAAAEIAALATAAGATGAEACDLRDEEALAQAVTDARLVVNTTPLGMAGEALPDPCHHLTADQVAYDLIYSPARTPFLADAERAGASAHNGLGMLVGQAAASFERWTGRPAPRETMLAAASRALAERR
jgi:shikimate dehydrogenase